MPSKSRLLKAQQELQEFFSRGEILSKNSPQTSSYGSLDEMQSNSFRMGSLLFSPHANNYNKNNPP